MLSNLSVRSNLIENCRTPECHKILRISSVAPLARISARDLHELSELNPMWPNYLDVQNMKHRLHGLPTQEQCRQWESYLFYGDNTVSLSLQREAECWLSAARNLCSFWPEIKGWLNLEIALECLCVLIAIREHPQVEGGVNRLSITDQHNLTIIEDDLLKFFHDRHLDLETLIQRSRQILGLID